MVDQDKIQFDLVKLLNGERILRLTDPRTGLSLEKKLKPAETESAELPFATELPIAEAAPAEPKKTAPKKAAIKKGKGRDLVVDEPGAKEVAER